MFYVVIKPRPQSSKRTYKLMPYTTLFRSRAVPAGKLRIRAAEVDGAAIGIGGLGAVAQLTPAPAELDPAVAVLRRCLQALFQRPRLRHHGLDRLPLARVAAGEGLRRQARPAIRQIDCQGRRRQPAGEADTPTEGGTPHRGDRRPPP